MTTLTSTDITTTSPHFSRSRTVPATRLEYFGRPTRPLLIDDRWTLWLRQILANPASVQDDLVTAPSAQAILIALDYLAYMNRSGAPPDIVTLGPNGEIVFERRGDGAAEQLVIYDDCRIDLMTYRDGRLEDRRVIAGREPVIAW